MKTEGTYYLGIDMGTSSTKGLAVDGHGSVLQVEQVHYTIEHPSPDQSEQQPDQIAEAVLQCLTSIVRQQGPPAAISFSNAMHSIMAVDAAGQPLSPLLIWADNRSLPVAERLKNTEAGRRIYAKTGTPIHPMSPLCKIAWWKDTEPALFAKTALFVGIKEYVLYRLLGKFYIDDATASATGMFNIHTHSWSKEALAVAGIGPERLAEVVRSTDILRGLTPAAALRTGLPENTPIVPGGSDGCLAQLGSDAMDEGHATLTIGTSGAVRMATTRPQVDAEERLFTYILQEQYISGGAINNGGVILQWYAKQFLPALPFAQALEQALALPPGADQLLCLPFLLGERAPMWDSLARGAFVGVQPGHTPLHFLRALMEGMAYDLLEVALALQDTVGPIKKISVSGGFTASPGWIQLLANIFQLPMHLQQQSDASTLGAIRLAMEALGQARPHNATIDADQVFAPDAAQAVVYGKYFALYRQLYGRLKSVFEALHAI
ncbi:gluconate kinase, FGGY family [Chitinophaga costaii]|uniref:Gluconate kinase, FGGY family n=1 Tax=Chitinophaga costaii TaxID=1335309 RepID=A0A1C4AD67_9BACT|nr:gluconokinase [Chitinophaga costaii]PUZ26559.1 gluconate kinase [Chitinophaga costaii]SCB92495.1 gluconate kinase, FGGY family [Chitinophaga costaii]